MPEFDYDLFVIGAGSGGVRASRVAAGHGARVAVAEDFRVGGTCVIRGCVPKKLLTYAAHFSQDFEDAAGYGWTLGARSFSWPALIAAKDREIARLEGIYTRLLEGSGVALLQGRATLADAHTVQLGVRRFTARHILVATGGAPVRPPFPGSDLCITSNEAFHLPALPARVLMVGGGYIAVEFAGIFRGLGSAVTLAYRGDQILRGFDDDVRAHLAAEIVRHRIDLRLRTEPVGVERLPDGSLRVSLRTAVGVEPLQVDAVMLATGRAPNTAGLGLGRGRRGARRRGRRRRRRVRRDVDPEHPRGRRRHPPDRADAGGDPRGRRAGGDAVRGPAHAGRSPRHRARGVLRSAGGRGRPDRGRRARGAGHVQVYKASFRPMKATLSGRDQQTLMKLVVDGDTERVVGAHMVGADAPEIIQMAAIAVKAGLTKAQFDATMAVHPTAAEEFVTMR